MELYLNRLKLFFRWLFNRRTESGEIDMSEWKTSEFMQIKHKTNRISVYAESEICDKEDI